MEYAKDGYAFYSVSTPTVFHEIELPRDGELKGEDLRRYKELLDIADRHRATLKITNYRLG